LLMLIDPRLYMLLAFYIPANKNGLNPASAAVKETLAFPVVVSVTVTCTVPVLTKFSERTPRFARASAAVFAPVPPTSIVTTVCVIAFSI